MPLYSEARAIFQSILVYKVSTKGSGAVLGRSFSVTCGNGKMGLDGGKLEGGGGMHGGCWKGSVQSQVYAGVECTSKVVWTLHRSKSQTLTSSGEGLARVKASM